MKGLVVQNKTLSLQEGLDMPQPRHNEVLVKVICASVNPTDSDNIQGKYDLLLKLSGGNHLVKTGLEFSGVVMNNNGDFKQGDKVFGYVDLLKGAKTHQEYFCINKEHIALMPKRLNFEEAAALPLGSLTSLVALRELGGVAENSRLLVNGAAGGLGVYALQIARILGASTTAIAGPNQDAFLKKLGADTVHNYREVRLEDLTQTFDVLLDLSNQKRFKDIRDILSKNGRFIPAEPNKHVMSLLLSVLSSRKTKYLMVDKGNRQKLTQIAQWVDEHKLEVFVDSVFELADFEQAFKRLDETGKRGRVIMRLAD